MADLIVKTDGKKEKFKDIQLKGELVQALEKNFKGREYKEKEGQRHIFYVPFAKHEDPIRQKNNQDKSLAIEVAGDKDGHTLRAFAQAVQKNKIEQRAEKEEQAKKQELEAPAADNSLDQSAHEESFNDLDWEESDLKVEGFEGVEAWEMPEDLQMEQLENEVNPSVSVDRIIEDFNDLSKERQEKVLQTAFERTPIIVQHGTNALKAGPNDIVNVMGHGWKTLNTIQSSRGHEMTADQFLPRMQQDLGNDIKKIKLNNCGSGGKLVHDVENFCSENQMFPGALVRGYAKDKVMLFNTTTALEHLDQGMRYVTDAADFKQEKAAKAEFLESKEVVVKATAEVSDLREKYTEVKNDESLPEDVKNAELAQINAEAKKATLSVKAAMEAKSQKLQAFKEAAKQNYNRPKIADENGEHPLRVDLKVKVREGFKKLDQNVDPPKQKVGQGFGPKG